MNKWKFDALTKWEEVWSNGNMERWNNVLEHSAYTHVFFHPTIVKAWVDTYIPLRHISPIFIWATDNENNEGFLPLVLWKKNWKNAFVHSIIPIGYSDYDYHDPIFTNPVSDYPTFWQELFNYIQLHFKYDELIVDGITDRLSGDALGWIRGEICPSLALDDLHNEDELFAFLKTSLRGDIRRQIRRMEEIGKLEMKLYSNPGEVWNTFDTFMAAHICRWPNAYKAPNFHRNLIEYGLKNGLAHFSSLDVGGKPVAWHLGFTHRGRFYYYMPAGRQDFSQYSPVKIHLFKLIKWAIENKYVVYDHLRGDENYKSGWSNGVQYVYTMRIEGSGCASFAKKVLLKGRGL